MGPFSASLPPSSNSPRGRAVDPLNLGARDEGAVIGTASQNRTNQEQLFGTYRSGLSSPVGTVGDRETQSEHSLTSSLLRCGDGDLSASCLEVHTSGMQIAGHSSTFQNLRGALRSV